MPRSTRISTKKVFSLAVIVVFALIIFVSLLIFNLTPRYSSSAANPTAAVTNLKSFISNCTLVANSCPNHHQRANANTHFSASSISAANALGSSYDINPKVLLTLYTLTRYPTPPTQALTVDQTQLMQLAQNLKSVSLQYANTTIPYVYDHPQLGFYRLNSFNQASYILLRFAGNTATTKDAFLNLVAPENPKDGQIRGFAEYYFTLFAESPTQ